MKRSWVSAVVAALGMLSFAMLARQCRSGTPQEQTVAAMPSREDRLASRPGGAARYRPPADGDFDSSGDASVALDQKLARAKQRSLRPHQPGSAENNDDAATAGRQVDADGQPIPEVRPVRPEGAGVGALTEEVVASGTPGEGDANTPALSMKLQNSTQPEKGESAPLVEQGITFDQQGAHFGEDAVLALPSSDSVQGTAATISFWVKPDWDGENETNAALFQWRTPHDFPNRVQIFKNGVYLRFLFCDDTGTESGVSYGISHWKASETHAITATWGDHVTSLYVDGASVGSQEYNGELLIPPGTPWFIGSDYAGGAAGARGRISNFHIFPRAFSADEVSALVAQTRPAT